MKISKKIVLITLILFIFFASGCSKNLLGRDDAELDSNNLGTASGLEEIEEKMGEGDSSSAASRNFDAVEPGMPGNGAAGSFSAEPFAGELDKDGKSSLTDGGDMASDAGSEFLKKENLSEGDASFAPDWKLSPGQSFGSAEQGMPGNGASGSFSAEPFDAGPGSEFLKEEDVGEGDASFAPDWKFSPGQSFGSAEQGMPGNGASGSFSAEPFSGDRVQEDNEVVAEVKTPEPFLTDKGEQMAVPLLRDEEFRRVLPYGSSDRLEDIHFAFDKYDLDDRSRAILKENVAYLKTHPASRVEIQGHCDERGSNSYNISLGERRAQSTKSYLISLGLDESRIRTISYGEERPFCLESNEECWYQNRRAHFLISGPIKSSANPPE
jgi:peptidoglycan-associated lipoprotein